MGSGRRELLRPGTGALRWYERDAPETRQTETILAYGGIRDYILIPEAHAANHHQCPAPAVTMDLPYTETLNGEPVVRAAPGARHELICTRLHHYVQSSVADLASTRLLPPRSQVRLGVHTAVCPDLALVATATGRLWLAAEIVSSEDHRPDTVVKKQIYEEFKLPRLWMIDPRYDNAEVYHASAYGLVLKGILAGSELLTERLLPEFEISIAELFATPPQASSSAK